MSIQYDPKATEEVRRAAAYIAHCQDANGFFQYQYDFASGKAEEGDGNIVRQCGTASALAQYLLHFPKDTLVRQCVDKALGAFVKRSRAKGHKSHATAFVCASSASKKQPLGATALALLTELFFHLSTGSDKYASYRYMWLQGILANRIHERKSGFKKYNGSTHIHESDYYNGECLYALAVYSSIFVDQNIMHAVQKAQNAMIRKYRDANFSIKFFHWGQLASSVLFKFSTSVKNSVRLAAFVRDQIASALLKKSFNNATNTCYFLEGLLAGYHVLMATCQGEGDNSCPLLADLEKRIVEEKKKNLLLQIKPNAMLVSFGNGRYFYSPDLLLRQGSFRNGRTSLKSRIDSCQHCLSALLPFA